MGMRLAVKTMEAIDKALEADQGASFRQLQGKVLPHIGDAYRGHDSPFRAHMGASLIGGECGRAIWYGWRWVTKPHFSGRILRLFNRGHLEEGRIIALLLMIGVQVYQQDENGKQFRISHAGGHFGGSGDGVAIGVPDLDPGTACLLEFKTHGDKSFQEVSNKGVREAKFEHYVQMNTYMRKMGLAMALYVAVNKNTDAIHMELVVLDIETADQFLQRGETLIGMPAPPKKLNESPGFWKCRMCDHRGVCHSLPGYTPERNCRTCAYSAPADGGQWVCNLHKKYISTEEQLAGCTAHEPHSEI